MRKVPALTFGKPPTMGAFLLLEWFTEPGLPGIGAQRRRRFIRFSTDIGGTLENIESILNGIEGLTDEQAKAISEGVKANYRTVAEVEGKTAKLKEAQGKLEAMEQELSKAKELEGGNAEQLEAFKARIAELEEASEEAKAKSAAEAKRSAFKAEFAKVTEGKQFANSLTENAVFERMFTLSEGNPDMSAGEALAKATEGMEGLWANAQRDPKKQLAGAVGGTPILTSVDQLKTMSADDINANWDTVKKLLKQQ